MRIAHLISTFLPTTGGAEHLVHNLALTQARAGHDVSVVTRWPSARLARPRPSGRRLPYRVLPLVPTTFHQAYRARAQPRGHWLLRAQIDAAQRSRRFDVWHVHMAHPAGWAAVDCLASRARPAVLTSHGLDLVVDPDGLVGARTDPVIDARVRAAVPRYPVVTAIGSGVHDAYLELGVAPDRIRDIPNGIDVERFATRAAEPDRAAVRERLGVAPDAALVLTVARHDPHVKGLDVVVDAAPRLAAARPDCRWLVVGAGVERLGPGLATARASDRVLLRPPPADPIGPWTRPGDPMIDLYRAADLLVAPSRTEGLPLVVLEAMAAGLPVVASDLPATRDVVEPERSGRLVPAGDAGALADAILAVLADPEGGRSMGARGRALVASRSLRAVADAYDDAYRAAEWEEGP